MVTPALPHAQVQPTAVTPDYSIAWMIPVYTTAIIVPGVVLVVAISVLRADSKDCPETIRALTEMFRAFAAWFRRGGPPSGAV